MNEGLSVRATEEAVALGVKVPARRKAAAAPRRSGAYDEIAERLGDRLDTRVAIAGGRGKGKVTIEFASPDDLARIADVIDPRGRR